jgi:hypothetical protein
MALSVIGYSSRQAGIEIQTETAYPAKKINTKNWKQIFSEKESLGHSPNFHILVSVSDLYIPTI